MTISAKFEGKCKGFPKPDGSLTVHQWKAGDQIHYQKEPKCVCINEECFNHQKSQNQPVQQKLPNQIQPRTDSEKTDDNKAMLEINWQMAKAEALKTIPLQDSAEEFGANNQRVILAEVFFKSLVLNWVRN
jgi:hypothetical protein